MRVKILSRVSAAAAMTIWGMAFIFSKRAMVFAEPLTLLMWRFTLAFLLLNIIKWAGRIRFQMKGKPVRELLLLGFLQPILYFICENYGVKYSSATFSGVMIALMPIAILAGSVLFLKEKISAVQAGLSVLSVAGVIIMSVNPGSGSLVTVQGALFMTGAIIAGAAFTLLSRNLSDYFTPFERTYFMFAEGFAFCFAAVLVRDGGNLNAAAAVLREPDFLTAVLYLGALASVAAFFMQNFYVSHISVAESAVFINLSTVVTIFAGIVILGEPFTAKTIPCAAMIIAGVIGVQLCKKE